MVEGLVWLRPTILSYSLHYRKKDMVPHNCGERDIAAKQSRDGRGNPVVQVHCQNADARSKQDFIPEAPEFPNFGTISRAEASRGNEAATLGRLGSWRSRRGLFPRGGSGTKHDETTALLVDCVWDDPVLPRHDSCKYVLG